MDAGKTPEPLGNPCDHDADCAAGAFCLTLDSDRFFGGGSAVNVCVADCEDRPSACDAFDDAVCFSTSAEARSDAGSEAGANRPSALCFDRCTIGPADGEKCPGARVLACAPLVDDGSTDGFCRPVCTTDADCPGRRCDPRTGACVDTATEPSDFGVACDPSGTAECSGVCTQLSDDYAVCSHRCLFGEPGDCAGLDPDTPTGGCLYVTPGGSIGDVGFCAKLCDCSEDCAAPGVVCDPLGDPDLEAAFGRAGVCPAEGLTLGEPIVCEQ